MRSSRLWPRQLGTLVLALALSPLGFSAAEAPSGHFNIKGDVVEDTKTKLTWQRHVPTKSVSAVAAMAYCSELDLEGTGWRLPTIKELHTLIDETKADPAVDREVFPQTPANFFWTSSNLRKFEQYTWSVNFADGTDAWFPRENPQRVRCVR